MPALSAVADILDKAADQLENTAITSEELSVRGLPGQSGAENKLLMRTRDQVTKRFGANDDLRIDVEIFVEEQLRREVGPNSLLWERKDLATPIRPQAEVLREFAAARQKKAKELQRVHWALLKARRSNRPATPLTPEEQTILEALADNNPTTMTRGDLTSPTRLTERTIGKYLSNLRHKKLVWYPHGSKKGNAITEAGMSAIGR